jgi:hypothetical protein
LENHIVTEDAGEGDVGVEEACGKGYTDEKKEESR